MRLTLALLLALTLTGCSGVTFFSATSNPGRAVITTSGTVSIVHLTITNNNTQITVVTLLNNGFGQTFNFCGNVVDQFPPNVFVNVNFTETTPCFSIVQVFVPPARS